MALVDLWWTDAKTQKGFQCSKCPAQKKKKMRCAEPGYENVPERVMKRLQKKGDAGYWDVDSYSGKYLFCPGKATWSNEIAELFTQCRVAAESGFLPGPGMIDDQHWLFAEVFPDFIDRWNHRKYYRTWRDVLEFTPKVLEQVAKMVGAKVK